MTELEILNVSYSVTAGHGPSQTIAILLRKNGIGDDIHAMPALAQKVRDGFRVVIYGNDFTRDCFESVGCEFRSASNLAAGTVEEISDEFGSIYDLSQWCRAHEREMQGTPVLSRFAQFAELIGTTLPTEFSWKDAFDIKVTGGKTLTAALYSDSQYRSFTRAESLRCQLHEEYGDDLYSIGPIMRKSKMASFDELITRIAQSRLVISIDTGILAIALALNVPTLALFGPTDEHTIAWQFRKYHKNLNLVVDRADVDNQCVAPCSFDASKGWDRNGECSKFSKCMAAFDPLEIMLLVAQMTEVTC